MIKPIVELHDYHPDWARQFEDEKNKITDAIGDEIIGIEHIGSTSIKGLGAKPIIDMMVGVKELDRVDILVKPLAKIEYEYVPKSEFKDRRFFRKGLWGNGTCHLHICEFEGNEWYEKLLFRNYLRAHPETAEEYYALKKELASKYKYDRPTYTKNKGSFIKAIIQKAIVENGITN